MSGILIVAFWCWFAVSLGILFRRAVRKASNRPAAGAATSATAFTPTSAATFTPTPADAVVAPVEHRVAAGSGGPAPGSIFVRATPAPAGSDPSTGTNGTAGTATVADALRGIRMPCDLTPLTGSQADFDHRIAFVTVGYPAEAVAPEVADEIERLGMTFHALSETSAIAARDGVRVKVAVHTVGSALNGIADPRYPTAPERSVVVEFELA
jgi:hypothetical protein